jgi:outer membrane protein assembly factor BamE
MCFSTIAQPSEIYMQMSFISRTSAVTLIAFTLALAGCSTSKTASNAPSEASGVNVTKKSGFLSFISPYRVNVQQGNFVSKEMVANLKPGMTKEQVRFALGTPLLTDVFHQDRWDYEFRLAKGNGEVLTSRVSVFFKDTLMDHYTGGEDLPTEAEYLSLISGASVKSAPESSDKGVTTPTDKQ